MPKALPNNVFRYIQEEETDPKWSFSESVLQGFGGNNNYIKANFDRIQALIDSYFANGAISYGSIFLSAGTSSLVTPNSKNWYLAFIGPQLSGVSRTEPHVVVQGQSTHFFDPNSNTNYTAQLSGNTLSVSGWAHEWSGFGLYVS